MPFSSSMATNGRVEPLRFAKTALPDQLPVNLAAVEALAVVDLAAVDSLVVADLLPEVDLVVVSEAEAEAEAVSAVVTAVVPLPLLALLLVASKLQELPFHQTNSPILRPMVGLAVKSSTCAT